MSSPAKLSAPETLKVLRALAEEEAELERVEAMNDDELEAYLVEKGVDLRAIDRRAAAFHAKVQAGRAKPGTSAADSSSAPVLVAPAHLAPSASPKVRELAKVRALRPAPKPDADEGLGQKMWWLWIAAAVAAAVGAGGAAAAGWFNRHEEPKHDTPDPQHATPTSEKAPDDESAERLRSVAKEACAAKEWIVCLKKLDQARAKDPGGDSAPEWQRLRDAAYAELQRFNDGKGGKGGGSRANGPE